MRCTVCKSTGFSDDQCLGCGVMLSKMPKAIKRDWDYQIRWDQEPNRLPVRQTARIVRECYS